jgi:hypothetical protein
LRVRVRAELGEGVEVGIPDDAVWLIPDAESGIL